MNNLENKKISVILLLTSIIGIIIGHLIRQPLYNGKYQLNDDSIPLKYYYIDFFGYGLSYKFLLIILLILLGIGIYCFLFKKDEEIEKSLIIFKNSFKKNINLSIFKKSAPEINENFIGEKIFIDNNKTNILFISKKIESSIKDSNKLGDSHKILKSEANEFTNVKKSLFKRLFSYEGRIRRSEYIISFTIFLVLYVAMDRIILTGINPIIMLAYIPLLWFLFAQGAKRCHDRGNSGWYQIIPIYLFWLLSAKSSDGDNQYGVNPKEFENKNKLNKNEVMNKIYKITGIIVLLFISVVTINKLLKNELITNDSFVSVETKEMENAKLDLIESTRKMNELLPLTIDEYTTATKVEYLSNENRYISHFELNGVTNEDFDQESIDAFIETQRLKKISVLKKNPVKNKSFVTAKTTIESIFKFANGVVLCSYKIYPDEYSN